MERREVKCDCCYVEEPNESPKVIEKIDIREVSLMSDGSYEVGGIVKFKGEKDNE